MGENVLSDEKKVCKACKKEKLKDLDFYKSKGSVRSECKKCTITRNVANQRRTQVWKNRFVDEEKTKSYMVDYYSKNKEKFAEYRRQFKEKYPEYHKEYMRKWAQKKKG